MFPNFSELYAMAFSWDPSFEFRSIEHFFKSRNVDTSHPVADVGAGTGRFLNSIVGAGFECYAIEPDDDMFRSLELCISTLPKENQKKIIPIKCNFETTDLKQKLGAVIAMTDTLSYVLPEQRLNEFLQHAHASLVEKGLLLIDVGIWNGYAGELREEKWAAENEDWTITAVYRAFVSQVASEATICKRTEILGFEARGSEKLVERSQQRELYSFSARDLINLVVSKGFGFCGAVEPGRFEEVDFDKCVPKRIIFCFESLA